MPKQRTIFLLPGPPDQCWLFPGALNNKGYGMVWVAGRKTPAHRAAYEAAVGPIPNGLTIDHLCRNRACYNPAHLEPVPLAENHRRKPTTETCRRGHAFTPDNTRLELGGTARRCLTCRKESR